MMFLLTKIMTGLKFPIKNDRRRSSKNRKNHSCNHNGHSSTKMYGHDEKLYKRFLIGTIIFVSLTFALQAIFIFNDKQKMTYHQDDRSNTRNDREHQNRQNNRQLNVVLFYADDWTMNILGKLNSQVKTPNLDSLIDNNNNNSILFTNNCVTTSVCWISRATLVTGLYYSNHLQDSPKSMNMFGCNTTTSTTNSNNNNTSDSNSFHFNWKDTLFPRLKNEALYYTGIVGKWHSPAPKTEMELAFNEYHNTYYGKHWYDIITTTTNTNMNNVTTTMNSTTTTTTTKIVGNKGINTERITVTELNKRHAIEFLQSKNRPRDQKFALMVSFYATHSRDKGKIPSYQPDPSIRNNYYPDNNNNNTNTNTNTTILYKLPHTATEKHYQMLPYFLQSEANIGRKRWYNRFEFDTNNTYASSLTKNKNKNGNNRRTTTATTTNNNNSRRNNNNNNKKMKDPIWQKNIRDLYSMATEVDNAIGEIINELKQQQVYNDTLIIFTTDNGDLHGEHGLVEKWFPFEESIKVPLIIKDPRMSMVDHKISSTSTNMNEAFTLNVDLAPTILHAAGLKPSSFMQGRNIAELYLQPQQMLPEFESKLKDINDQQQQPISSSSLPLLSTTTSPLTSLQVRPWREDWFYEWNTGLPENATGHKQENTLDAAFALITKEWKYIYWPQKQYEQLYHRSLDKYDEYDILQNYYLQGNTIYNNNKTTPYGDSIESTRIVYKELKERYHVLKQIVQNGDVI